MIALPSRIAYLQSGRLVTLVIYSRLPISIELKA